MNMNMNMNICTVSPLLLQMNGSKALMTHPNARVIVAKGEAADGQPPRGILVSGWRTVGFIK